MWLDLRDASSKDWNPADFISVWYLTCRDIAILSVNEEIFYIYFLHICYQLLECSVHEKSYCISAYIAAGEFPTQELNPQHGAYILTSTERLSYNSSAWIDLDHKMRHISCLFKPEKISTKLGINFDDWAKIQTLTTGWPIFGKDLDFIHSILVDLEFSRIFQA